VGKITGPRSAAGTSTETNTKPPPNQDQGGPVEPPNSALPAARYRAAFRGDAGSGPAKSPNSALTCCTPPRCASWRSLWRRRQRPS